jgi:hypothetical protein
MIVMVGRGVYLRKLRRHKSPHPNELQPYIVEKTFHITTVFCYSEVALANR